MFFTTNVGVYTHFNKGDANQNASLSSNDHETPQLYPLKLHITLDQHSFEKDAIQTDILDILIKALLADTCHQFKMVNKTLLQAELKKN